MNGFVSVGFGNYINLSAVITIAHADSAPMRRLVQVAKEQSRAVDVTQGRRTKAVIVMSDGSVVLSALLPETIVNRTGMVCETTEVTSTSDATDMEKGGQQNEP